MIMTFLHSHIRMLRSLIAPLHILSIIHLNLRFRILKLIIKVLFCCQVGSSGKMGVAGALPERVGMICRRLAHSILFTLSVGRIAIQSLFSLGV